MRGSSEQGTDLARTTDHGVGACWTGGRNNSSEGRCYVEAPVGPARVVLKGVIEMRPRGEGSSKQGV